MKSRIVSLAPSATSILFALGVQKQLVGVTRWCKDVAPVDGLPELGDCWRGNPDKVAALQPTLVIGSVPYTPEVVRGLLRRGLTFLAMNPRTLADVFSDIEHLGRLLGREKQAAKVTRDMRARMDRVAAKVPNGRRPRVYCESWPKPRLVSPAWVDDLVTLAGGRFVPPAKSPSERAVTDQAVRRARPDVVVLGWAACGLRVDARKVLQRPGWDKIPAVQSHRVFVISDEALNTPGPPLAEGLELLARIIHPEVFGEPAHLKVAQVSCCLP
ncbi:MAG: helical backbone metal receptor [Acidobacteria bacterium]|nr:helical backbone metal receptor [Acidobacteriota bacterium]